MLESCDRGNNANANQVIYDGQVDLCPSVQDQYSARARCASKSTRDAYLPHMAIIGMLGLHHRETLSSK